VAQVDQLVERSADLKGELLRFAQGKRFANALSEALEERFGATVITEEQELIGFFDHFLLQRRFSDGRTMVERFVRARGDLPRAERNMMLGWVNVVEGLFEVECLDGEALVAVNLIDELTYRIHSNMGVSTFEPMPPGSFLIVRLVPVLDEWLISGSVATFTAESAGHLLQIAADRAIQHPEAVFRNPRLLERGWELQRHDRAAFLEFFGTDLVVLTGAECEAQMKEFRQGQTGDSAASAWDDLDLADEESVAMIYDEDEGLGFFTDFRRFQQVFENPDLVSEPGYAEIVQIYLSDNTVSLAPFRRCAERWPDGADEIFARVLGKPDFSWARDGEALLRSAKPEHAERPPRPRFVPVGPRLAEHLRSRRAEPQPIAAT